MQDLTPAAPSGLRAWCYLVWLGLQRQARARQMVWIALGLVGFTAAMVAIASANRFWYFPRLEKRLDQYLLVLGAFHTEPAGWGVDQALLGASRALIQTDELAFLVFSRNVVFALFLSFLLPMSSLSFATEAIGGEREAHNLLWLLTRPLPRPAVYLAKYVALLPWCLGFNMGGFALLCLAGGHLGAQAFALYWPAVVLASLAFSSLFFLFGACFRRPAVVAIVYSFFLEVVLAQMPGTLKRVSIGFYTRCLMFEAAEGLGVQPEKPSVYYAVDGTTAFAVLAATTVILLVLGMVLFSRSEYQEGV